MEIQPQQAPNKRRLWLVTGLSIIGLGIVAWGVFSYQGNGCQSRVVDVAQTKFHQYPGEKMLSAIEMPPDSPSWFTSTQHVESNKVLYKGKTYEICVQFNRSTVSPVPGSELKGKITVLENGRRMTNPGKLGTVIQIDKPVIGLASFVARPVQPLLKEIDKDDSLSADQRKVQGEITTDYTGSPVESDGRGNIQRAPITSTHLYSPQFLGDQSSVLSSTPGLINDGGAYPFSFADIDKGTVNFTYVFDGIRALPYVNFYITLPSAREVKDERGPLSVLASIPFEDQVHPKVAVKSVNNISKGDNYYEIHPSVKSLKEGTEQTIGLKIVAKDTKTNRVLDSQESVRVWALPAKNDFYFTDIKRGGRTASTIEPGAFSFGDSQSVLTPFFVGLVSAGSYGNFEGQNALVPVEVPLDHGTAQVNFEYNGKVGNQPILLFEVAAVQDNSETGSSPVTVKSISIGYAGLRSLFAGNWPFWMWLVLYYITKLIICGGWLILHHTHRKHFKKV